MSEDEKVAYEEEKAEKKAKQLEVLDSIADSPEPIGPDETQDIINTFVEPTAEVSQEEIEVQNKLKEKAANDLMAAAVNGDIDPSDADDAAEALFNAPK